VTILAENDDVTYAVSSGDLVTVVFRGPYGDTQEVAEYVIDKPMTFNRVVIVALGDEAHEVGLEPGALGGIVGTRSDAQEHPPKHK